MCFLKNTLLNGGHDMERDRRKVSALMPSMWPRKCGKVVSHVGLESDHRIQKLCLPTRDLGKILSEHRFLHGYMEVAVTVASNPLPPQPRGG